MSSVAEDISLEYPELLSADTTTVNRGGALRWLAPELLGGPDDDDEDIDEDYEHNDIPPVRPRLTTETDIYSFAMTIIEVHLRSCSIASFNTPTRPL